MGFALNLVTYNALVDAMAKVGRRGGRCGPLPGHDFARHRAGPRDLLHGHQGLLRPGRPRAGDPALQLDAEARAPAGPDPLQLAARRLREEAAARARGAGTAG